MAGAEDRLPAGLPKMATTSHTPKDDGDADVSIGSLFRITFGCIAIMIL